MVIFPGSKINLGLRIVGKRADGYHNLRSVFYPLELSDILELVLAEDFQFSQSGSSIPGKTEDNIVIKAYRLLQSNYDLGNCHIHLHKVVPSGGGIGGGSANGTAALLGLNELFSLNIGLESLHEYALELGSDCPFFLYDSACDVGGRGEIVKAIDLDLSEYRIKLVNPGIHISTAEAFGSLVISAEHDKETDWSKPESWKETVLNDFESGAFQGHPELKEIKDQLYREGAVYASMTGTGSSVYGIFKNQPQKTFPSYFEWVS